MDSPEIDGIWMHPLTFSSCMLEKKRKKETRGKGKHWKFHHDVELFWKMIYNTCFPNKTLKYGVSSKKEMKKNEKDTES